MKTVGARRDGAGASAGQLVQVPTGDIHIHHNVRRSFDEAALDDLASSVREFGILEPLLVRPVPEGYALVAGERRLRAAMIAGLETVPVVVREMDEAQSVKLQLLENLQRQDLDPVEEGSAYELLIETHGMKAKSLAQELGVSESQISNRRRLLKLPPGIQDNILHKKISPTVALNLVDYAEFPAVATALAGKLIERGATQATAGEIIGQSLRNLPVVAGPEHELTTCDAGAHGNCPCRRKTTRYGRSIAVCLDANRFDAVEAEAKAKVLARAATQAAKSAEDVAAGDVVLDLKALNWNDWGHAPQYRRATHCKGDHGACACRRQATDYSGDNITICVDPKAFDKLERAAARVENAKVKQVVRTEQEEATAWAIERVDKMLAAGAGTMVPLRLIDLAYLAAWVLSSCEAEYGATTGVRRADKRAYMNSLGVQWNGSGPHGYDRTDLCERLKSQPRALLLRIIVEWPLLAESKSSRSLGHWYKTAWDAEQ